MNGEINGFFIICSSQVACLVSRSKRCHCCHWFQFPVVPILTILIMPGVLRPGLGITSGNPSHKRELETREWWPLRLAHRECNIETRQVLCYPVIITLHVTVHGLKRQSWEMREAGCGLILLFSGLANAQCKWVKDLRKCLFICFLCS